MVLSANEAWLNLLEHVVRSGEEEWPRGKRTLEIIGATTKFDMSRPVITIANRKMGYKFLAAEAWWLASGSNRVDQIAPYSKNIANFSDDGLTFRGSYGPKIADQLPWVAEQLAKDGATRQAVMTIWRERPGPTKDYPCTISTQWLLRRRKDGILYLNCQVTMRSSDAWTGAVYDWFNETIQTAFLIAYVRTAYPDVFKEEIRLGTLTFTAGSQHLYEENIEAAKTCLFESDEEFKVAPLNPALYQADPYKLLDHVKSLADRDALASPYGWDYEVGELPALEQGQLVWSGRREVKVFDQGYLGEFYSLKSGEKNTGFDANPLPRGIKVGQ